MKKSSGSLMKTLGLIAALTFLAGAVAAVTYYMLYPSRGFLTSDTTDTIMWALASWQAKAVFNPDFYYAGFLPFSGYLLMVPFFGLFGFSFTTHILGMLLFVILFTASIVLLARTMRWNATWTALLTGTMLLILSSSVKLREIFLEHNIYYSLGAFFLFIGFAMAVRALDHSQTGPRPDRRKFWLFLALLFGWTVLCSTNKIQSISLFTLPLMGALAAEVFFNFNVDLRDRRNAASQITAGVIATGVVAGMVLGQLLIGEMRADYQLYYSTLAEPAKWMVNFNKLLPQWTTLLGVEINAGDPIASVSSLANMIRIALAAMLWVVPVVMGFLYNKIKDRALRLLIIAHWVLTAIIMFGYIFGNLSDGNWRLSPIICTALVLCVAFCKWIYENTNKRRLGVALMALPLAAAIISGSIMAVMPKDYLQDQGLYPVKALLEKNGLTYGYATFWNANVMTLMSDDHIRSRAVNIYKNGMVEKCLYQTEDAWYDDQPGVSKYFLITNTEEYKQLTDGKSPLLADATATLTEGYYTILVFDKNIF